MPEITIQVAGKSYPMRCGEGEEAHLMRLAQSIDVEATKLARKMPQVAEGRLMLMAALMLADKLHEAEQAIAEADKRTAKAKQLADSRAAPTDLFNPEREAQIAASLDALADRIDSLAGRVEAQA